MHKAIIYIVIALVVVILLSQVSFAVKAKSSGKNVYTVKTFSQVEDCGSLF